MIQTEYQFVLPVGFQDEEGNLHRDGTMRLATAADEITPLRDGRVQANPAYLIVILLSRGRTQPGELAPGHPQDGEKLYRGDPAPPQKPLHENNPVGPAHVSATWPQFQHRLEVEGPAPGGFLANP